MPTHVLALDQGTTSSRALLFNRAGRVVAQCSRELKQYLPFPGHVEHDPEEIWSAQLAVAREVLAKAKVPAEDVAAIGIANQRETTVLWERASGRPVARAIVWQSRISTDICAKLRADGLDELFRARTGLVLDPYFSGTKIRYLLDTLPGLRTRAEAGEICFGTIESFLVWRLTGGRRHITDVSNASRTLLMNLRSLNWDDRLLAALNIPRAMLPEIVPSSGLFDLSDAEHLGRPIPISGLAGDQQAATFGQACFTPGSCKNTYGTGCFLLLNTGAEPIPSRHGLLTTVGWQVNGDTTYCLEGSVFVAGATVQWLRDGLNAFPISAEVERLAATVSDSAGVVLVPAFVGLGAPYWDPLARGAIFGITRGTTLGHIARAAVEAMSYQTRDVLEAMQQDSGLPLSLLKVDGGASVNDALLQFQADQCQVTVERPVVSETTALGAAYLAGLAVGYWDDLRDIERNWALDRRFTPSMPLEERDRLYRRWQKAVSRTRDWEEP